VISVPISLASLEGLQYRSSLRHYATSLLFAGAVPYKSTGFSVDLIIEAALWALVSAQPLREMITINLPEGNGQPTHV
jgi:hypothetical protein